MQPEAAYRNPPESKSENSNPLVPFPQQLSPKTLRLAQTIYELRQMGLIREVIDTAGVVRWELTEKSL
jgi:hypothetical protein